MLRKATKKEIQFFENKLYPLQDKVLALMNTNKFYLSGGTCLSRFYYQHRYSVDLDFFFDGHNHPKSEFNGTFNELTKRFENSFQVERNKDDEYFKRVIVHQNDITLKLEFILEFWEQIGGLKKIKNFYIDSKENLATNKITTVYGRKTEKDYFDLLFLLKEFPLKDIIRFSETKMVPLDYEGVMLCLHGTPFFGPDVLMIKKINEQTFIKFIKELQMKLIDHAKNLS